MKEEYKGVKYIVGGNWVTPNGEVLGAVKEMQPANADELQLMETTETAKAINANLEDGKTGAGYETGADYPTKAKASEGKTEAKKK